MAIGAPVLKQMHIYFVFFLLFFFCYDGVGRTKEWASSKMSSDKVHDVFISINIYYYLNRQSVVSVTSK